LEQDKDWDGRRELEEFRKLLAQVKNHKPASETTKDAKKED